MHRHLTLARTVPLLPLVVVLGMSLPTLHAQSQDFARVIELEGQVSVMRGGQVALFQSSTPVCSPKTCVGASEVIVTGPDGHAIFEIADHSKFEIFPNSQVAFRNTYTFEDLLNVILGKIRVQIEHRNGPNPKKVSTPTAVISVRGTVFDVSVEEGGATLVSVEEGVVDVRNTRQPGNIRVIDAPNSIWIYPDQPLAKAGGTSPGMQIVFDKIAGAARDILLRPIPSGGGIGLPGGGQGGPVGQGDKGGKKNPPAPPNPPPPPSGGGGGL